MPRAFFARGIHQPNRLKRSITTGSQRRYAATMNQKVAFRCRRYVRLPARLLSRNRVVGALAMGVREHRQSVSGMEKPDIELLADSLSSGVDTSAVCLPQPTASHAVPRLRAEY